MVSALLERLEDRNRDIEREEIHEFLKRCDITTISELEEFFGKVFFEKKKKRYERMMEKVIGKCKYMNDRVYKLECKLMDSKKIKYSMYLYDSKGEQALLKGNGELERVRQTLLSRCKEFLNECVKEGMEKYASETTFQLTNIRFLNF